MNFDQITFVTSYLIAGAVFLLLSFMTLFKNRRNPVNRSFSLYALCGGGWSMASVFGMRAEDALMAVSWDRLSLICAVFIPAAFIHFISSFCDVSKARRYGQTVACVFSIAAGWFVVMPYFTQLPEVVANFHASLESQTINQAFCLYMIAAVCWGISLLSLRLHQVSGYVNRQTAYVFWSVLFAHTAGLIYFASAFDLSSLSQFVPLTNYAMALYALIVSYAITRLHPIDFRVVLTRTFTFLFVAVPVVGLPYALTFLGKDILQDILGEHWFWAPMAMCTALAAVGPSVFIALQKPIEARFRMKETRVRQMIKKAYYQINAERDIDELMDSLMESLVEALDVTTVSVYLHDEEREIYAQQAGWPEVMHHKISGITPLVRYLKDYNKPLSFDELKSLARSRPRDENLQEAAGMMADLRAAVIVPTITQGKLVAFIVLGERKDKSEFAPGIVQALGWLGMQAAIAIDNALYVAGSVAHTNEEQTTEQEAVELVSAEKSVEEVVEEDVAIKDEAPQQASNRIESIVDDVEERKDLEDHPELTMQDALHSPRPDHEEDRIDNIVKSMLEDVEKEITEHKFLEETEESSEEHKIDKAKISFKDVMQRGIERVREKYAGFNFSLIDMSGKDSTVLANAEILEEAVFGVIDSACASVQAKEEHVKNDPSRVGYRPQILLDADMKDKVFTFTVEDNGLGSSEQDKNRIDSPVYATTAEDDATGVYSIRQCVALNGGELAISSTESKGTVYALKF